MVDVADREVGRKYGGYVVDCGRGMIGILREAMCGTKFGWDVRLERSMDVRDDNGDVVF